MKNILENERIEFVYSRFFSNRMLNIDNKKVTLLRALLKTIGLRRISLAFVLQAIACGNVFGPPLILKALVQNVVGPPFYINGLLSQPMLWFLVCLLFVMGVSMFVGLGRITVIMPMNWQADPNPFAKLFLAYFNPLFRLGSVRPLQLIDLGE